MGNLKKKPNWIAMKPRAFGVSSILAPWSMATKSTSAAGYIPTKR